MIESRPDPVERQPADDRPRVLVADDDQDTRLALQLMLEDTGYVVLEAEDGVATLDALLLSPTPLIVVLDVLMPRMTGYEVLLQVARDPLLRTRHAYIVLTAAQLSDVRIGPRFSEVVDQVGAQIVAKPFDIAQMLRCVAQRCQRLGANAEGATAGDQENLA